MSDAMVTDSGGVGEVSGSGGAFFRKADWVAFWVTTLVTGLVYFLTLAPTVTLEDSGELAVASDWLGVPHPPGYPIWTLVTWFFQWIFHWVQYNGHPNPAWGVGLASAVSGALACGLLALLISRSGADLLGGGGGTGAEKEREGDGAGRWGRWLCAGAGVSGGLLLAFSPVLWSQSVIVEVYSLNAFFQMWILLLIYMWMRRQDGRLLWLAAFLFGLGLTNHQTLLFLGVALALAVLLKDEVLFRDFAVAAVAIGVPFALAAKGLGLWVSPEKAGELVQLLRVPIEQLGYDERLWKWSMGPNTPQFWVYNYLFLAVPVSLWLGKATEKWQTGQRVAAGVGAMAGLWLLVSLGHAFFASPEYVAGGGYSFNLLSEMFPAAAEAKTPFAGWLWKLGPGTKAMGVLAALCLVPVGLSLTRLPNAKTVAVSVLLAELGVAFYLYLPIASDQNPPMNWGYPRTWEGFMHAVTRGQYEAIVPTDIFSEKFVKQLGSYLTDLRGQFTLPVAMLGFLPFCAWGFRAGGRRWSAFPVAVGLVLAATALVVVETALGGEGGAVERAYRVLLAPVLLGAGWGLCLLVAEWLKELAGTFMRKALGTQIVLALLAVGVAGAVLLLDWYSLRAVWPSAKAVAEAARKGVELAGVTGAAKAFYLGLVFGPPAGIAAALWLVRKGGAGMGFDFGEIPQRWLITSVAGFFSVSVVFLIFQNPSLDIQQLFIGRVQFIQSHALYALWLGYGVLLTAGCARRMLGERAGWGFWGAGLVLPGVLIYQNAFDETQIRIVGGAEQNGHSYGWQFGNWGLEGVKGIKEDFGYWYGGEDGEEFKEQWGAYCAAMGSDDPQYPPPMTTNAVFYGGTDPGRFVPTYMIYSADVRSDVYLITQNALADNTFMNITRDLYGDTIYIPSLEDSNGAFQKYVEDVQAGRVQAGAELSFENGRVSVQGVGGVMMINGLLAQLIFEENKFRHDFYVEESYVIQWMYPYLTPNGLMLKLNKERLARLPDEVVENDHRFWGWYTEWLLGQSAFRRDICARKAFSKLRAAIAGIYEYRGMFEEAEHAYRQAVSLYPLSPEAVFRLAQMFMKKGETAKARELLEEYVKEDPNNDGGKGFLEQIKEVQADEARLAELEAKRGSGPMDAAEQLELLELYRKRGQGGAFLQMVAQMLDSPETPLESISRIAVLFLQDQRIDAYAYSLERYLEREPRNWRVWSELALAELALGRESDAVNAVKQAIEAGGDAARQAIGADPRFQRLERNAEFRKLFPARPRIPAGGLQGLPGGLRI